MMLSTFLSRPQTFCCAKRCRANATHTSSPLREEWWNPQRSWAAGNSWPRQRSNNLYCGLWLLLANAVHYSFRIQADGTRRGEDNKPHQAPKRIQVVLAYTEGLWPLGKPYLPPTKRRFRLHDRWRQGGNATLCYQRCAQSLAKSSECPIPRPSSFLKMPRKYLYCRTLPSPPCLFRARIQHQTTFTLYSHK